MAPLRGWGPRGQRLRGFAPHGHWRTLTFLGALRCDHAHRAMRLRWPDQRRMLPCLCPAATCYRSCGPATSSFMDNLGSHKSAAIRQIIRAAGARLWFLPPYSPISIRSSRPSPRSSIGCAKPRSEPSKTLGAIIGHPHRLHQTRRMQQLLHTTPDTLPSKREGVQKRPATSPTGSRIPTASENLWRRGG